MFAFAEDVPLMPLARGVERLQVRAALANDAALAVGFSAACDCQLRGWVAAEQGDQLGEQGVEFPADLGDVRVVVAG